MKIGIGAGIVQLSRPAEPPLIEGSFTAGVTTGFVGYNRDPWVTDHDWDSGSAYGTPPASEDALVIVDSSGQCLVVLNGAEFKFEEGITLTIEGLGSQFLDFWAGNDENESWHDYGYVYGENSDPIGLENSTAYNFTIEVGDTT